MSYHSEKRGLWTKVGLIIIFLALVNSTFSAPVHRWADASSYYMMISSIANDLDIKYEKADIDRAFINKFDDLPNGLYLIKNSKGELFYGKEFTYPLIAAPFYKLMGNKGILMLNAALFFLMIVMGYSYLRRNNSEAISLVVTVTFFILSTAAVYIYWIHAEIYNMFLIMAGFYLWFIYLKERDQSDKKNANMLIALYLAAIIFGVAIFSKLPNVTAVIPLLAYEAYIRRFRNFLASLTLIIIATLSLYLIYYHLTGSITPYAAQYLYVDRFPFWQGYSANCGYTIPVGGDLIKPSILSADGLFRVSLNFFYYLFGRFTGIVWYYPFVLLSICIGFMAVRNNNPFAQPGQSQFDHSSIGRMFLAVAMILNILLYIYIDYKGVNVNYFGGGHALGNRYFYFYPAYLFLIGSIEFNKKVAAVAVSALLISIAFVVPNVISPIDASSAPMLHTTHMPYSVLPLEYSEIDYLPLWSPPPVAIGSYVFYFPETNIEANNSSLVIAGSYRELLFKSPPIKQCNISISNLDGKKAITLGSGRYHKEILLDEHGHSQIEMPLEAVFNVEDGVNLYKMSISVEPSEAASGKIKISFI